MPSKGTTYLSGKRDLILDKEFCNNLREKTGLDLDDKTIRTIILESNAEIATVVADYDDGFKLPEELGYIVVTKYPSKKRPVDWINSKRLRRTILLPNLHSFGFVYHIKWFKKGLATFAFRDGYRIEPTRLLKRRVAKNVKSGKTYHQWTSSDFWSKNKILKRLYRK